MNNMVLKIGNTELGLRALGDGDFEFKNTEVALNELENLDFVIKNQMSFSPKASNQKMNTPTLFFNDKLVTLNQIQPNLFEPTSYKLEQEEQGVSLDFLTLLKMKSSLRCRGQRSRVSSPLSFPFSITLLIHG